MLRTRTRIVLLISLTASVFGALIERNYFVFKFNRGFVKVYANLCHLCGGLEDKLV